MLMISAREEFWSSTELSDYDEARNVNLSDHKIATPPVGKVELLTQITGKKVLILIHGYNNEEDDVVRAYGILEEKARAMRVTVDKPCYDVIIGFTWPGGNDPLDYFSAKRRAGVVAPRLVPWLEMISDKAESLDIMCHSMGCRISLMAAKGHPQQLIRNLYLTAAAVDNESIERDEEYFNSIAKCAQTYVFHSKHDPVLALSYKGAEWDLALGYSGPENPAGLLPKVKVVNCKNEIYKHGGYKDSDKMYSFWRNQLVNLPAEQFYTL